MLSAVRAALRAPPALAAAIATPARAIHATPSLAAGHNKWSKIRHKKGDADTRRALVFSRLGREIINAVKSSGSSDPSANAALAALLQKARSLNMPKASIESAIKKAQGPDAVTLTSALYEGTAHGFAFVVESLTDNGNRAFQDVRKVFTKADGNLSSVGYMFSRKGLITVAGGEFDAVFEDALEAGAEDVEVGEGEAEWVVTTPFNGMYTTAAALRARGHAVAAIDSAYVPLDDYKVPVATPDAEAALEKMVDQLEALDDVLRVHTNATSAEE
ncbi:hypothetical protein H9P43_009656 [Blastocladiella emersonii ATCC 22665]|nr:hypothetical protein H9P43_009656 [Blastocladiella emersonii ATCC 22665]